MSADDLDVLAPNPHDEPCPACNAEAGEDCRPGCLGEAAYLDTLRLHPDCCCPVPADEAPCPVDHAWGNGTTSRIIG